MSTSNGVAEAEQPHAMSEWGRLFGIFWEPGAVFKDLAVRPRWLAPFALLIAMGLIYTYAFSQIVGWQAFLEREFARNPRLQQMSTEMQRQIIQQQKGIVEVMSYVGTLAGTAVALLAVAGVMLLAFRMAGSTETTFRQFFGATCYAWLPFALYQGLSLVVMTYGRPEDFDLKNPLPFNPGWFLDTTSPAWLVSLASSLDLFSFWVIGLLALGYSTVAAKVKFGRAVAVVAGTWALFVLAKTGWAAIFG